MFLSEMIYINTYQNKFITGHIYVSESNKDICVYIRFIQDNFGMSNIYEMIDYLMTGIIK